jgi:predicted transcriptional regulator
MRHEDQKELRDRLTQEALAEARSGLLIGDEEVKAWADSLDATEILPVPRPNFQQDR